MNKKGSLIVISGPSGCGKGTIVEKLIEDKNIEISVSCTTRNPRPHEKDGVNYFFKTQDEFDVMVKNDDFLEYANVF
ncbi:MAG: guanylate kinase, partial [Christensenellaceae bacterium]